MSESSVDELELACLRSARRRTLARILWSAQAEGIADAEQLGAHFEGGVAAAEGGVAATEGGVAAAEESVVAALAAVRVGVAASCAARGLDFDDEPWAAFVSEVLNSLHNESLAIAWRERQWRPALRRSIAPRFGSLWEWLGSVEYGSEQAQLAWETCASFDGHLTHPCAKTKLGLSRSELLRYGGEFGARPRLLVCALARSATIGFVTPSCGAHDPTAYFAARFPAAYAAFVRWLRGEQGALEHTEYVPLPMHPASLEHVRLDFSALIEQRLLLIPHERSPLPTPAVEHEAPSLCERGGKGAPDLDHLHASSMEDSSTIHRGCSRVPDVEP